MLRGEVVALVSGLVVGCSGAGNDGDQGRIATKELADAAGRADGAAAASGGADAGASTAADASGGATDDGATTGPKCGANPTELVDFNALAAQVHAATLSATPLAVDATNVNFVFSDALMRVPIRGGSVATMASLPNLFSEDVGLTLTMTSVILHHFLSDHVNEQIVSVPIAGGNATNLATTNGRIDGFGANEEAVYFVDQSGVQSVPTLGGSVKLLTNQFTASARGGFGEAIAIVGSNLIMTTSAQGGGVVSVPLQGGPPTTLATAQPNASFPMPCGADVCWWTGATPPGVAGSSGPGAIERRDASGALTSLPQAPYFPWSLVFDGTSFFETVGCDVCDGSLVRIPAAGGPSVSMGSGSFVTVDDSCA